MGINKDLQPYLDQLLRIKLAIYKTLNGSNRESFDFDHYCGTILGQYTSHNSLGVATPLTQNLTTKALLVILDIGYLQSFKTNPD